MQHVQDGAMTEAELQTARDRMATAAGRKLIEIPGTYPFWANETGDRQCDHDDWLPDQSLDQLMLVVDELDVRLTLITHTEDGCFAAVHHQSQTSLILSEGESGYLTLAATDQQTATAATPALAVFNAAIKWMDENEEQK